jgi:hypothetical protein
MKPINEDTGRPIAYIDVSLEMLEDLLFPEGTRIRDASYNFVRMAVEFVVEHEDLEAVPPGAMPPRVSVTHTRIEKEWTR